MKNYKFLQKPFNLLQAGWTNKTFSEKLYDWAVNVGRYIVIGTELVVLVAFGVRFFLDQNLNDINDKVNSENQKFKAIYSQTEKDANDLSKSVGFVSQLEQKQIPSTKIIENIVSASSNSIIIESIDIGTPNVTVIGTASSTENVTTFRSNLQKNYKDILTNDLLANSDKDQNNINKRIKFTLNFKYAESL